MKPGALETSAAAWLAQSRTWTEAALEQYRQWLGSELKPGQRMENVRDLRPEVRQTLERAEKFLGLAALVAVLLAAVAVALAASRYLRRHLDAAAMLRCFGATRVRALADEPRPEGAQKLAGTVARYRIRQGEFRILYEIDDRGRRVVVVKIGHRREVYR